jgi:hypothetical protein
VPVAEIAAAVTGIRSALDITKAMVGLRDAEAFRAKSIELQGVVLEALDKAIEARESYAAQNDRIRALEAEVARLKAWDAEKQRYDLKSIGQGAVAYVLKPDERGAETPHWLCPNCFAKGQKAFLQNTGKIERARLLIGCNNCGTTVPITKDINGWAD